MLAEIFIVRAETLARASQETIPVSRSPFIPFDRSAQLRFKGSNTSSSRCEIVDTSADQSRSRGRT
jgi:hypothetical protein